METWHLLSTGGPYLWCFTLSIVSALIPWVNGEVLLLSLMALSDSTWSRVLLVFSASAGQMAGKCVLYWAGQGVIPLRSRRVKETMASWRERFERSPKKLLSIVFVSSAVGIPPFYVVTILAGALRVRFGPFFTLGACGRVVRFGVLAFLPWMAFEWLR